MAGDGAYAEDDFVDFFAQAKPFFNQLKLAQADIGNFFVICARVINNIEAHVRISFSKQPVLAQRECADVILRLKGMSIANDKIDLIFILCPPKFNLIQPGVL